MAPSAMRASVVSSVTVTRMVPFTPKSPDGPPEAPKITWTLLLSAVTETLSP